MKRYLMILPMLWLMGCQPDSSSIRPNAELDRQQIQLDRKASEYNTQLGVNYMQRGEFETALEKLEKALRQDPNSAPAHHTIAILYANLAENTKAEYHYERALEISPKYSEAHNNYGVFLCQQGQYEASITRFLTALQNPLYREAGQAYENAGLCAKQIPDITRAEGYSRKALQINANLGKALLGMAQITYQRGDYTDSYNYINRYRRVASWTPEALLQGIRTARRVGDEDAVASYIVLLRGQFPDSDQAQQLSGGY